MSDDAVSGQYFSTSDGYSDSGVIGQALAGTTRLYPVPRAASAALLAAGAVCGAVGDALLRAPGGPVNLNLSLWIASVAVAALALHRRVALTLNRERVASTRRSCGRWRDWIRMHGALTWCASRWRSTAASCCNPQRSNYSSARLLDVQTVDLPSRLEFR
jgi:hypothetical protein